MAAQADAQIVAGSSLKAAMDLDWDNPNERNSALTLVLGVLESLETFLEQHHEVTHHSQVQASWEAAQQVKAQDIELDDQGVVKLRQGVAKERRISIEDEEMRHGRKSRSQRINGYKRHVLRERQLTAQGRAKLRERVAVEHCLSHIGRWQGDRARYGELTQESV